MKKKQLQELRKKTVEDIDRDAALLQGEIAKARVEVMGGTVKNVRKLKLYRRDLAQVLGVRQGKIEMQKNLPAGRQGINTENQESKEKENNSQ